MIRRDNGYFMCVCICYHSAYFSLSSTSRKYEYAQLKFRQDGWEVAVWTSGEIILHNVLPLQHNRCNTLSFMVYNPYGISLNYRRID
jgi:hypothetical protein